MSRSLIRVANLHEGLAAITGDLCWDNLQLKDALLETSNWIVGPKVAIDPMRLTADND